MSLEDGTGRVAIIAGGGRGVGAATAGLLAARGFNVAVTYNHSLGEAEDTVKSCKAAGTESLSVQVDVVADADCRRAVDMVAERWGRIDVLVNSAGATQFTRLSDLDDQNAEDFQRVFAVNVLGAYQMARAAGPWLRASGRGAIVNVSSIAGLNGNGSSLAYIASKGGLNSMTLALARLFAPEVRVNAILPGLIDTRWFLDHMAEEAYTAIKENFAAASALQDVCTAEDVAGGAVFLAVDALKMTGQLVTMDSGYLLGRAVRVSK